MFAAILTVGQLARAGAERIFDLLDSTPLVQDAPDARRRSPCRAARCASTHVTFGYTSTEPVLATSPSRSRRARPSRSSAARARASRRSRCCSRASTTCTTGAITIDGVDVRDVTLDSLRRSIGVVFEDSFLFSDTITRQHRVRPARRDRRRGRGRGARRRGPRVHHAAARRLRHRRRRAGPHALGRPAPAHRARPGAAHRPADPAARRRDLVGRRPHRGGDPRDAAPRSLAARTTILIAHRRSTLCARRPHRRGRPGPRRSTPARTRSCWARCRALPRCCSPGPGDDAEGIDARRASRSPTTRAGRRHHAVGVARPRRRRAARARRSPTRTRPRARGGGARRRWRRRRRRRRRRGMGRRARADARAARAGRRARRPADDEPDVDVAAESRAESTDFTFLRVPAARTAAGCSSGSCSSRSTRSCTLAGPLLVRYGIDEGVAQGRRPSALWVASRRVPPRHARRLVGDVGRDARHGPHRRSGCCYALRIKVFAHLQRLGVDYYEHEMAGRIMTRMTTDIDALSQLLQNGLVNALVNLVTFVGVGVALVFIDPQLALVTALDPAAARHRDALVPARSRASAYEQRTRAHRGGQREPPGGPVGRARVAGVRARGHATRSEFERDRGRLPRRPRRARSGSSRSTSRSSTSSSDIATCIVLGVGQRARARTASLHGRRADRVPALPRPVLRADPAALAGVRLVPAGAGRDRAHQRAARHADVGARRRRARRAGPRLRGEVALRRRALPLPDTRSTRRCAASTCAIAPGETVALVGETGAGQVARSSSSSPASTTRPRARCCVDGVAGRPTTTWSRSTSSSASCRRRRSCSRARSATTSRTAGRTRPTPRSRPRRAPSARTTSSPRCPAATCSG